MKKKIINIKEYEALKAELLNAEKIAQKHLANADVKEKTSLEKVLNAINQSITMTDTIKSLIESEAQAKKEVEILTAALENHAKIDAEKAKADAEIKKGAKTIKVISNRCLKINDVILEYKQIAEIQNNDEAKRCLKSGLITMI